MGRIIQKLSLNYKTFFLSLSLILWVSSNPICGWFFPANDEISVRAYWELRKIIYSICIILIVLSASYTNKIKKFISLIFIGVLAEDISDRIQGITYFQYSDLLILDLIILTSAYSLYKEEIKYMINKMK